MHQGTHRVDIMRLNRIYFSKSPCFLDKKGSIFHGSEGKCDSIMKDLSGTVVIMNIV